MQDQVLMKSKRKVSFFFRVIAFVLVCVIACFAFFGCNEEEGPVDASPMGTSRPQSSNKKRVAITYDDGPHNTWSRKIADELDKYGYNATFFVVGNRIAAIGDEEREYNGLDTAKYVASKGNELAIHGYTHNYYYDKCESSIYNSEISNTKKAILKASSKAKVKLMRPVGGRITDNRAKSSPYSIIMWSIDSEDWKLKSTTDDGQKDNVEAIAANVLDNVKSGDIILMHDIYENTYEATKIILKQLKEDGYDVVTVSELLGTPKKGTTYSKLPAAKKNED